MVSWMRRMCLFSTSLKTDVHVHVDLCVFLLHILLVSEKEEQLATTSLHAFINANLLTPPAQSNRGVHREGLQHYFLHPEIDEIAIELALHGELQDQINPLRVVEITV